MDRHCGDPSQSMNFSLKSLVILAISGALSGEAKAIDSGFYNGSHVCNGALTLDDWEFRHEESSFEVFFRKTTASSFQKLELVAQDTDGGLLLVDRRGRPWIAVRFGQNGDSLQGRWLTGQGKPQSDCEPFTLSRSESAKARMNRLFGLLARPVPPSKRPGPSPRNSRNSRRSTCCRIWTSKPIASAMPRRRRASGGASTTPSASGSRNSPSNRRTPVIGPSGKCVR